jgi:hypothetical protein
MDLTLAKHICYKPRFCIVSVHLEEDEDTIVDMLFPLGSVCSRGPQFESND